MKFIEIKPLTPCQVPEMLALDQICFGGLWTEEGYLREIDSPNSSLLALSIVDRDSGEKEKHTIIGVACLWAIVNEAHITLLAIHPDYRRKGLGELLLLTLLKDAIAKKLEWATLEVNTNNSGAINLYKKFGFQVAGKRKKYYQETGEDALILWCKGIQQPNFELSLSQWQQNIGNRLSNNYYCVNC